MSLKRIAVYTLLWMMLWAAIDWHHSTGGSVWAVLVVSAVVTALMGFAQSTWNRQ